MRRLRTLVPVLTMVLAACASAGGGGTTTAPPSSTTEAPATVTTTTQPTTTSQAATEATSGRPAAPDFTLELGDGGSYTLSEGTKPVYLVFWAEW